MLRRLLLGVATAAALGGCGSDDPELPAGCTRGQDGAVLAALRAAPGDVRIDGTPLSTCLRAARDGAEIQNVGIGFVEAAATLATEARRQPGGKAAEQLGYLVAAAHRGGSEEGPHAELLRRLDQELTTIDTSSAAFRRGQRAGSSGG